MRRGTLLPLNLAAVDGGWTAWGPAPTVDPAAYCKPSCSPLRPALAWNRTCTAPEPLGTGADCEGRAEKALTCPEDEEVACPIQGRPGRGGAGATYYMHMHKLRYEQEGRQIGTLSEGGKFCPRERGRSDIALTHIPLGIYGLPAKCECTVT